MTIRPGLLDELLKDYAKPEDLIGEEGLLKQLTKALVERCLETEMDVHLNAITLQSNLKTDFQKELSVDTKLLTDPACLLNRDRLIFLR